MCGGFVGDVLGISPPKPPRLPAAVDPNVARQKAAEAAGVADVERRRKVAAGGRPATLLAGQQVAEEQQRKTLLGQ